MCRAGLRAAVRLPGGVRGGHEQHLRYPRRQGALHLPQASPRRTEAQKGKVWKWCALGGTGARITGKGP